MADLLSDLFHLVQLMHQARFSPGGIVLVNDTLLSGLVQCDDRHAHGLLSLLCTTMFHQVPGLFDRRAGSTTEHPVMQTPAFRAT